MANRSLGWHAIQRTIEKAPAVFVFRRDARLIELVEMALERPKLRIKTKPFRGAREERIKAKTVRGHVKKMRSRKVDFD